MTVNNPRCQVCGRYMELINGDSEKSVYECCVGTRTVFDSPFHRADVDDKRAAFGYAGGDDE